MNCSTSAAEEFLLSARPQAPEAPAPTALRRVAATAACSAGLWALRRPFPARRIVSRPRRDGQTGGAQPYHQLTAPACCCWSRLLPSAPRSPRLRRRAAPPLRPTRWGRVRPLGTRAGLALLPAAPLAAGSERMMMRRRQLWRPAECLRQQQRRQRCHRHQRKRRRVGAGHAASPPARNRGVSRRRRHWRDPG